MEFVSVRELCKSPKAAFDRLARDGKAVITNNGQPQAILVKVDASSFESALSTLQKLEFMQNLTEMRLISRQNGNSNVLVSSLLSNGLPALIVDLIAGGKILPCFDDPILSEYWDVFSLPKFGFSPAQISRFVHGIIRSGHGIEPPVPSEFPMPDENDRKFYDVAKNSGAILITGNTKHLPQEPFVLAPANFLRLYQEAALPDIMP
jgi:putative PIN family toxin of toxin-antitoxin system